MGPDRFNLLGGHRVTQRPQSSGYGAGVVRGVTNHIYQNIDDPRRLQLLRDSCFSQLWPLAPLPLFPYTTLFRSFRPVVEGLRRSDGDTTEAGRLVRTRSEEHTSELQSRSDLVCRLLPEKKKAAERTVSQCDTRVLKRLLHRHADTADDTRSGRFG